MRPNVCAASGSGVVKQFSKQEKERQRKERQKQRKLAELESALQYALSALSQQGLRWVHTRSYITPKNWKINRQFLDFICQYFWTRRSRVESGAARSGSLRRNRVFTC